jgi:hypothetical protein
VTGIPLTKAFENAKKDESRGGLKRTNSELEMLAEKAALLGRDGDEEDDLPAQVQTQTRPRPSPLATENLDNVLSPGELNSDPLAQPTSNQINILSPSTEAPEVDFASINSGPKVMSEKMRGKMRATSISSLSLQSPDDVEADEELMKVAEAGVGPNGYVPTQEWVTSWQKG